MHLLHGLLGTVGFDAHVTFRLQFMAQKPPDDILVIDYQDCPGIVTVFLHHFLLQPVQPDLQAILSQTLQPFRIRFLNVAVVPRNSAMTDTQP
jgi:hypothetical protein